jgi:hypothetical protein
MGDPMSDDKKLPVRQLSGVPVQARDEYLTSPVRGRSLLGRAVSRFVARLNTSTINANTEEVQALTEYAKERGALADTMLDAERRIAHYIGHRDDIIEDDHEVHLDQMQENKHQRDLNRRRREQTTRALDAAASRGEMEQGFDHQIAAETKKAALAQAKWQTARAEWGHDAFAQSMPFRKERIEHLYKTGALDAEIERLITESGRDEQRRRNSPEGSASSSQDVATTIEQLLAELNQEIENAHATHASDDQLAVLYAFRSRLSAKLKG